MRMTWAMAAVLLAAVIWGEAAAPALAQSCEALWIERNSIYKRAGYCFKTPRAISYFGNAGCRYDVEAALPLSRGQRARIAQIVRAERALGCN